MEKQLRNPCEARLPERLIRGRWQEKMDRNRFYMWLALGAVFWGVATAPLAGLMPRSAETFFLHLAVVGVLSGFLLPNILVVVRVLQNPKTDRPVLVFIFPLIGIVLGVLAVWVRGDLLHEF